MLRTRFLLGLSLVVVVLVATTTSSSAEDPPVPAPYIDLAIEGSYQNRGGDPFGYAAFTVRNLTGLDYAPAEMRDIQVQILPLPHRGSPVGEIEPGETYDHATGIWTIPRLRSGATTTLRLLPDALVRTTN